MDLSYVVSKKSHPVHILSLIGPWMWLTRIWGFGVIFKLIIQNLYYVFAGKPDSKTFDLTLMITLLRNLASIDIQDQLPVANNTSIGAAISRIKYYRNQFAHPGNTEISGRQFKEIWTTLEEVRFLLF